MPSCSSSCWLYATAAPTWWVHDMQMLAKDVEVSCPGQTEAAEHLDNAVQLTR